MKKTLIKIVIPILFLVACKSNYIQPEPKVFPISLYYDQAEEIAIEWKPDAKLYSIHLGISLDYEPYQQRITYMFRSENDREFLNVYIYDNEFEFSIDSDFGDWPNDRPIGLPIEISQVELESKEAMQLIMDYGGSEYFQRYEIREVDRLDYFELEIRRLDLNRSEGPTVWIAGFGLGNPGDPHAQLYIFIEDSTGDLLKVRAYGEEEQEVWFREITETKELRVSETININNDVILKLESIRNDSGIFKADFSVAIYYDGSPSKPLSRNNHKINSKFSAGGYEFTIMKVSKDRVLIDIMPIERWYKKDPLNGG